MKLNYTLIHEDDWRVTPEYRSTWQPLWEMYANRQFLSMLEVSVLDCLSVMRNEGISPTIIQWLETEIRRWYVSIRDYKYYGWVKPSIGGYMIPHERYQYITPGWPSYELRRILPAEDFPIVLVRSFRGDLAGRCFIGEPSKEEQNLVFTVRPGYVPTYHRPVTGVRSEFYTMAPLEEMRITANLEAPETIQMSRNRHSLEAFRVYRSLWDNLNLVPEEYETWGTEVYQENGLLWLKRS